MTEKLRFEITGMSCSACAQHVEKAVTKLKGVTKANVNLLTNRLTADVDSSVLGWEEIVSAVEKAGYGAFPLDLKTENAPENASDAEANERLLTERAPLGSSGEKDSSFGESTSCGCSVTSGAPLSCSRAGEGNENQINNSLGNLKKRNGSPNTEISASAVKREKAEREMKIRLIVSLVFMILLMYVAMGHMLGAPLPSFLTGVENAVSYALLQLLLAAPIIYFNRAYYINGYKRLFRGAPNMDTLVAVGSSASLVYGLYAIFRMSWGLGHGDTAIVEHYMHELYFESAGMILALVTVGKYLETKSKRRTGDALDKLKKLSPDTAIVLRNGIETEIPTRFLAVGDIVVIKAGMSVPSDGVVEEGSGFAVEAAISGESMPVEKLPGASVIGGTILKSGYLKARLTAVGAESMLQKIISLVEEAGAEKAPIQRLADKISGVFVPVVMSVALVTFIGWAWGTGNFEQALNAAVAVLVISCPCALGLATPVAVTVGTGKGAENGILIKSGEALERLHGVKYVVLDKTGTITAGEPEVSYVNLSEEDLSAVAALEKRSEHPLGEAVVGYFESNVKGALTDIADFETLPGKGVRGRTASGSVYAVGNALLMKEEGVKEELFSAELERVTGEGKTPLLVSKNGTYAGLIATSDFMKAGSAKAIRLLKKAGLVTIMLTGDNRLTAQAIAREAGVDEVIAEVLPGDKAAVVEELKKRGKVAMVGDGINDAPALKTADIGIAIGSGADIAVDSADVILIKDDLMDVVNAVRLSDKTIKNIKENLFWAFFYNVLGIPIAAGVLYVPFGIMLSPMIGALAMSCSSLFVVGNALRLKLFKPLRAGECSEENAVCSRALSASEQSDSVRSPAATSELSSSDSSVRSAATETDPAGAQGVTPEKSLSDGVTTGQRVAPNRETPEKNRLTSIKTDERRQEMTKTLLKIEGMMCMHCVGRVEKALKAVEGVERVDVSLEEKSAVVTGGREEALKAAVAEAGYEVTGVEKL